MAINGNAAGAFMTGFMSGYKFVDDINTKQEELKLKQKKEQQDLDKMAIDGVDKAIKDFNDNTKEIHKLLNEVDLANAPDPAAVIDKHNSNIAMANALALKSNAQLEADQKLYGSNERVKLSGKDKLLSVRASINDTIEIVSDKNGAIYTVPSSLGLKTLIENNQQYIDKEGFIRIPNKDGDLYADSVSGTAPDKSPSSINISKNKFVRQIDKTEIPVQVDSLPPVIKDEIIRVFGKDTTVVTKGVVQETSKALIKKDDASKTNEGKYIADMFPLLMQEAEKNGKPITEQEARTMAAQKYQNLNSDMMQYVDEYLKQNPNATKLEAMQNYKTLASKTAFDLKTKGDLITYSNSGANSTEVTNGIKNMSKEDKAAYVSSAYNSDIYKKHISTYSNLIPDAQKIVDKVNNVTKAIDSGKLDFKGLGGTSALTLLGQLPTAVSDWGVFKKANQAAIDSAMAEQSIVSLVFSSLSSNVKGVPSDKDMQMATSLATGINSGNAAVVKESLKYFAQDIVDQADKYYQRNANILGVTNKNDYKDLDKLKSSLGKTASNSSAGNISQNDVIQMVKSLPTRAMDALKSGQTVPLKDGWEAFAKDGKIHIRRGK